MGIGGTTAALKRVFRKTEATGTGTAAADVTVPVNEVWKILGTSLGIVTNTGGGSRKIRLEIVDGVTVKGGVESPVGVIGDDDVIFMFGPGLPLSAASVPPTATIEGTVTVPMFEAIVNAGQIIRGRVRANGDAADVITLNVHAEVMAA